MGGVPVVGAVFGAKSASFVAAFLVVILATGAPIAKSFKVIRRDFSSITEAAKSSVLAHDLDESSGSIDGLEEKSIVRSRSTVQHGSSHLRFADRRPMARRLPWSPIHRCNRPPPCASYAATVTPRHRTRTIAPSITFVTSLHPKTIELYHSAPTVCTTIK